MVVGFGALGLDVLLDAVNGRFVRNQSFLDLVQAIVDLVLEDHVAPSVMLHRMVRRLLRKRGAVLAHLAPDRLETLLFSLVVGLELLGFGELVGHLVLHAVDVLVVHLHLFVHAALQVGDLLEIGLARVDFDLERGGSALGLVELTLLEVEVLLHLLDLVDSGQGGLSVEVLAHVLEQSGDSLLSVGHLSSHLLLISLILFGKLVDLLLLLVEHLKLLFSTHSTGALGPVTQLTLDVFDVTIILINHFSQVTDFFVLLLDLSIVLLDAIHETLSGLGEWQIVLIALELQVVFALLQLGFLFTQVLCSLLQRVLFELVLSGHESVRDILQFLPLHADLVRQAVVLLLQLFIFVALLGVKIIQSGLICEIDIVDLLFVRVELVFHVALLGKKIVQMRSLLIVLVFDMQVKRFNIFRFCVTSVLIKG